MHSNVFSKVEQEIVLGVKPITAFKLYEKKIPLSKVDEIISELKIDVDKYTIKESNRYVLKKTLKLS